MLVAESQLQLDPRTRSCLGLDSWLKRPFELHGILQTLPIVCVRSEMFRVHFFSEALAMNDEDRVPCTHVTLLSTRHQLPVGQW